VLEDGQNSVPYGNLMPEGFLEAVEDVYEEVLKDISDCYGRFSESDAGRIWEEAYLEYGKRLLDKVRDIVKDEWKMEGDNVVTDTMLEEEVVKKSFVPKLELFLWHLSRFAGGDGGAEISLSNTPILTPSWMLDMQKKFEVLSEALSEVKSSLLLSPFLLIYISIPDHFLG
jgi:hypothetical protein